MLTTTTLGKVPISVLFFVAAALAGCAAGGVEPNDSTDDALGRAASAPKPWLTYVPKQCGSNAWERPVESLDQDSRLDGEAGAVDTYFRSKGIRLQAVGFLSAPPSETPGVLCAACQCPRGDRLVVRAKSEADADRLVREYDFSPAGAKALGRTSISCNMNPWDPDRDTRGTAEDLGRWAVAEGASVSYAGFVEPTELGSSCRACTCARGDHAVALASDDAASERLVGLEFKVLAE